jgi:hypothetical protein
MKFFVAVAILLLAVGCSVFRSASGVAERAEIGMSLGEFRRLAGISAELESRTASETVYRMNEYEGAAEHRYVSGAKLFYFDSKERLYKIDTKDYRGGFNDRDRDRGRGKDRR